MRTAVKIDHCERMPSSNRRASGAVVKDFWDTTCLSLSEPSLLINTVLQMGMTDKERLSGLACQRGNCTEHWLVNELLETLRFFSRNTFVTLQRNCLTITYVISPWKCFSAMSNPSATKVEKSENSLKQCHPLSSPRSSSTFSNVWSHASLSTLSWHYAIRIETPTERSNRFSMNTICTPWMINKN